VSKSPSTAGRLKAALSGRRDRPYHHAMNLDSPFVQLPLSFDPAQLSGEVLAIPESEWRPHPQKFAGNSMLPLIAANGEPDGDAFAGPMRPTRYLMQMPYIRQIISTLGVTAGRTRLMRLDGQAEVTRHVDQGYYWFQRVRIHVPIVTEPSVIFECGDDAVNMAVGECWIFDTWRQHRVTNPNDSRRIHLVIDTVGGPKFWATATAGRTNAKAAGWKPQHVPFDAKASAPLLLETFNVPSVMTPWEIESYFSFLLGEVATESTLAPVMTLVARFIRDWRALWAAYGTEPAGRHAYMRTYDAFMTALQPVAAKITLPNKSNLFGVIASALTTTIVALPSAPVQMKVGARA
jgi:hypothetical protein